MGLCQHPKALISRPAPQDEREFSALQGVEGRWKRRWRTHRLGRLGMPYFARLLLGKPRRPIAPKAASFLQPHRAQPPPRPAPRPVSWVPDGQGRGPQRVSGRGQQPLRTQQRGPEAHPPSIPGSLATHSAQAPHSCLCLPHSSLPPEPQRDNPPSPESSCVSSRESAPGGLKGPDSLEIRKIAERTVSHLEISPVATLWAA